MTIHLYSSGIVLIALAVVHVIFPQKFNWKNELSNLSLINRQMMQVHTFFIALFVGLNGLLNILGAELLQEGPLAKLIAGGLTVFWGCRLFCQFFVYSPLLWKGKTFETLVHVVFGAFWAYLTIMYTLLWMQ